MKKILIIALLIVGCEDPASILKTTLSGTYSLTGYMMFDNSECTGESIIDESTAALTLTQLDYTYEFDGNSVTLIQVSSGIETFNQSCDYVIVSDILTPSCYPYPHTISSDKTEFSWEFGTTSDVTVEGITVTVSACTKYIFTKQ
tara:strand:+ start:31 stop:465 length:435 start_codon:yes stop_codon:yes gene_type:complete